MTSPSYGGPGFWWEEPEPEEDFLDQLVRQGEPSNPTLSPNWNLQVRAPRPPGIGGMLSPRAPEASQNQSLLNALHQEQQKSLQIDEGFGRLQNEHQQLFNRMEMQDRDAIALFTAT